MVYAAEMTNHPRKLNFGVYSGNGASGLQETRLLEQKIGRRFQILHFYTGFNQEFEQFERETLRQVTETEQELLISWAPGVKSGQLYQEIAGGSLDPYLHRWARSLKKTGRPVFLRFSYEMNMTNMAWFAGGKNGSAADFISAWRHLHDIFKQEGVKNVQWVWCPHADTQSPNYTNAMAYYPGDAYVDWIGLDGYYWGGPVGHEKEAFDRIFRTLYDQARNHQKPMMIAEIGGSGEPLTALNWHKATLDKLTEEYPDIQALVYFNADFSAKGERDWRLTRHEETLERLRPYLNPDASSP
jgi:beta-mannanase